MAALTPQVFWAQRHTEIYLRVELSDAKNVDVSLQENNILKFKAKGHGAQGENDYEFALQLLKEVQPQVERKITQRQVGIKLKKPEKCWWERLALQEKKPLFVSPDFDRWIDESDAEREIQAKEEKKKINRIVVESRIPKNPYTPLRKGYLFMYNLVQFLGFSWNFVNMTVRLFVLGKDSLSDTYHTSADMMDFCQVMAVLEVINPLLGVVKTGFFPAMLQLTSRNVILFVIFGSLEQMQNKPIVFVVFYLWSTVEVFRHPFDMLVNIGSEWKALTWIRYNLSFILYPLEVVAEAVAVIQSLPIFDETRLYSLPLPVQLGESLSFSYTLQFYLILMFLGLFLNLQQLYKQRSRHFRPKRGKME